MVNKNDIFGVAIYITYHGPSLVLQEISQQSRSRPTTHQVLDKTTELSTNSPQIEASPPIINSFCAAVPETKDITLESWL